MDLHDRVYAMLYLNLVEDGYRSIWWKLSCSKCKKWALYIACGGQQQLKYECSYLLFITCNETFNDDHGTHV